MRSLATLISIAALAAAFTMLPLSGCASHKPRTTETTVTETDPATGETITRSTETRDYKNKHETTNSTTVERND